MTVEHEVIEQIEDEEHGRTLEWVCRLVRGVGRDDPMTAVDRMWRAGHVRLVDDLGRELPPWRCEQIWRERDEMADARVMATDRGLQWVYGSRDRGTGG